MDCSARGCALRIYLVIGNIAHRVAGNGWDIVCDCRAISSRAIIGAALGGNGQRCCMVVLLSPIIQIAAVRRARRRDGRAAGGVGEVVGVGWRSIAVHLNLFYALRRIRHNGGAIYFRRLILFRGFYYKWSFTVCSGTIGVVIEYAFGDGVSIGRGNGYRPAVSPPAPVSEVC